MDDNAGGVIYLLMMKVRDNKNNGTAFNMILSSSSAGREIFVILR